MSQDKFTVLQRILYSVLKNSQWCDFWELLRVGEITINKANEEVSRTEHAHTHSFLHAKRDASVDERCIGVQPSRRWTGRHVTKSAKKSQRILRGVGTNKPDFSVQLHVYYACPEAIFWKLLETNFIRVFLFTELDGVKLLKDRKIFIIILFFILLFSFYAANDLFRPNPTQIEDFYCIFIYYYFCLMILPYY